MSADGRALPRSVEEALVGMLHEHTGRPQTVRAVEPIGGGCISAASRITLSSHDPVFLKWNGDAPPDFFEAEAQSLAALASGTSLRIPQVLGHSGPSDPGPGWLALEYVAAGPQGPDFGERLGHGLAELHGRAANTARNNPPSGARGRSPSDPYPRFGWCLANYIGTIAQPNDPSADWPAFWRDLRLQPQLERARSRFRGEDLESFGVLFDRLDQVLESGQAEAASLLHGDLWSGNVYADMAGRPVLVDPAVYRGHREVDLAMTELFGGFGTSFYEAYEAAWPVDPGYASRRRAVYQLYPLLVHVNLFGSGYVAGVRQTLRRALG